MKLRAWLLLALLSLAAAVENSREGVFVGYKEAGVEGAAGGEGDGGGAQATADNNGNGDDGAAAVNQAADSGAATGKAGEQAATEGNAADLAKAAEQVGRTVLLHTQFGPIRVKLLEKLAPRTTKLVWDLAQKRGCSNCAFYRNEARPRGNDGPPYSLLQGRLDIPEAAPHEGNVEVKMGHVCFIPDTKDFFIAYGNHPEWGTSHTVWGLVDEWFATDFIISQQFQETTHPEFGTVMRMLKVEVPVKIATQGDTTYSGLLGPLH